MSFKWHKLPLCIFALGSLMHISLIGTSINIIFLLTSITNSLSFTLLHFLVKLTALMNKYVTSLTQSQVLTVAWWPQTMRQFILCLGMSTDCELGCLRFSPISVCRREPILYKNKVSSLILFTVVNWESCDYWWWQWFPREECIHGCEKGLE